VPGTDARRGWELTVTVLGTDADGALELTLTVVKS